MGRAYGSFIRFGIRYMGLVKEPKNIDFTVINKKWTVSELNELSAFIKLRKEQKKKRLSKKKQRVKS